MAGAAIAAAVYAWWVTGLEPFSDEATVAVVGSGGVALALGRLLLPRRPPGGRVASADLARWGVAVAALAAWQLLAWSSEPRSDHPTLSSLANEALDPRPVRAVAVVAWLAGAAWLGRR